MSTRRLLWLLAALLLLAGAALLYSPRLSRHVPALDRVAAALLVLGLVVGAAARLDS